MTANRMNRAELIWMLNVSGVLPPCHGATENQFSAFERFAELAAETERKYCIDDCNAEAAAEGTAQRIIQRIRARGNP